MAVGGVEVRKLERWMSGELRGTKGVGGVSGGAQQRTGKQQHRIAQPASARAISHSTILLSLTHLRSTSTGTVVDNFHFSKVSLTVKSTPVVVFFLPHPNPFRLTQFPFHSLHLP